MKCDICDHVRTKDGLSIQNFTDLIVRPVLPEECAGIQVAAVSWETIVSALPRTVGVLCAEAFYCDLVNMVRFYEVKSIFTGINQHGD